MAKISGEIHKWCAFNEDTFIDNDDCDELRALIDRIDAETVELPRDKDGVPIHVGDMLRGCDAVLVDVFTTVVELRFNGRWEIETTFGCITEPRLFVHDSPDSLERIADELDAWYARPASYKEHKEFHTFADRIRKLAKEGE
ncbi:hypothetical protein ACTQ1D_03910 [Parafannyhessea umbonata]|uniref:hypothetical protein n=1 Tax=Parafannyhessea umbonata TaxID=604330 RepID=UPI003F9AB588